MQKRPRGNPFVQSMFTTSMHNNFVMRAKQDKIQRPLATERRRQVCRHSNHHQNSCECVINQFPCSTRLPVFKNPFGKLFVNVCFPKREILGIVSCRHLNHVNVEFVHAWSWGSVQHVVHLLFSREKNNKSPRKVNDNVIKIARVGYLCRLSFLHLDNVWKSFNRKTVTIESTLGRY